MWHTTINKYIWDTRQKIVVVFVGDNVHSLVVVASRFLLERDSISHKTTGWLWWWLWLSFYPIRASYRLCFVFFCFPVVPMFVCLFALVQGQIHYHYLSEKTLEKNYHQKLLMITLIIRKELCSKAAKKKISNTIPAITLRNTTTSTADIFLLSLFPFTFFNRGQSGDKNQLLLLSAPTTTATISKTRMKNIWITTTIAKPNHSSIDNCWFNIDEISEKSLRFLFLWFFGLFLLLHNW